METFDQSWREKHRRAIWALSVGGLVALGLVAVFLPPLYAVALAGLIGLLLLLGMRPAWLLIVLLLLRSSADVMQNSLSFFAESPFGFNAAGLMNITALGLGAIILGRRFARGQRWLPSLPMFLLAVMLVVAVPGIFVSTDQVASVKAWARLASYLSLALLAIEVADNEDALRTVLRAVSLAAMPPLILGYYQVATGSGYQFPGYQATSFAFRPQGTFGHPAILASFLLFLVCLMLAAYILEYPLWPRWFLLGLGGSALGLLLLTYARTEWIGAVAALGVIALLRYRRLFVLGLVGSVVLVLAVPTVQERLWGFQAPESFVWRLDVWDASLEVIRASPSWFGAGLDTSPTLINSVLVNVIAPPHNDFLRATLEMGVLGLLSFVLVNLSLLLFGWHTYRQPQLHLQVMGLTMLAVAVGGMVISLSDNYLSFVSVQWYNWTLVGLITASASTAARRWQPGG